MKKYTLPTGYLIVDDYSKGQLETLSIGDYGKDINVKADFLGYTKEINGVTCTKCKPLTEKWVITLSTQYGCIQKCKFCSVPNILFKGNATFGDLQKQLYSALNCFPSIKYIERLNIHFARMGEPIVNSNVFEFSRWLYDEKGYDIFSSTGIRIETLHPVMTTSLPRKFKGLRSSLHEWCSIKNIWFNGQAGLQISVNSTNEDQREEMFAGGQLPLVDFAAIAKLLPMPIGRKYCLNFAYASNFEVDAIKLASLFDPHKFMVKITPMHLTKECAQNGYVTVEGYNSFTPYRKVEEELKAVGFDVLVFVPSIDEEDGLVTCGNAILGGGQLKTSVDNVCIEGV